MAYIRRIVVVCGYGCHLTPELTRYLDRVVRYIVANDAHHVILCGGQTQMASAPGVSEAGLMKEYIEAHLPPGWQLVVNTCADSYTTLTNIKHAARVVRVLQEQPVWKGHEPREDRVTIFCEADRALKVKILARRFMPVPITHLTLETESWELSNPLWELVKTANEVVAMRFTPLAAWMEAQRIRKSLDR